MNKNLHILLDRLVYLAKTATDHEKIKWTSQLVNIFTRDQMKNLGISISKRHFSRAKEVSKSGDFSSFFLITFQI